MARLCMIGAILTLVFLQTNASAADWYRTEGVSCSGNRALGDGVSAVTGGGIRVEAGDGPGNFFAPLSASEFNELRTSKERISNSVTLNKDQALSFRKLFLSTAENSKVPAFITMGTSLITGLDIVGRLGTVADLLFSYLYSQVDAASVGVREAGLFFAQGGQVYRRAAALYRKSDDNRFLSATTEYKVSLGSESRTFVVHGCIYPLRIDVVEFQTAGQFNNKILKNTAGNNWRTWDIDSSRFEGDPYKFIRQESGFYYFEKDVIENDRVVGQELHRFSFIGGPWQRMRYDERPNGQWRSFYAVLVAR